MILSREKHYLFLTEELNAQTEEFEKKLKTSASYLLQEREEIFICQFVKFEDGEMILKFANTRGMPRKGSYLYCFTLPSHLHKYKEWGDISYGDMLKQKGFGTEIVCIWQSSLRDNPNFSIAGFRGVDVEFAEHISSAKGAFLVLGPKVPPYQYIHNLQNVVKNCYHPNVCAILDMDYERNEKHPSLLDSTKEDVALHLGRELFKFDQLLLQGPPGTGKTYQIAKLCENLCSTGQSVLVTSLTNRALLEVVLKLQDLNSAILSEGKVYKTNLSVDELHQVPKINTAKQMVPVVGGLMLSTFFISSGGCSDDDMPPFDVVIVDEASQALLGMFAAAMTLGRKCIFVGDNRQLPPVVQINKDRISRQNYSVFADGIDTMMNGTSIPAYMMTATRRLPARAARYTSIFYDNKLVSTCDESIRLSFNSLSEGLEYLLHKEGGPTLLLANMPMGEKRPNDVVTMVTKIVGELLAIRDRKTLDIAVLSFFVDTVKALQKSIYSTVGTHNNLLVETVSRIQGLTTDIAIYVVPNIGYTFSLENRLFNVATSRARRHTIIIIDPSAIKSQFVGNRTRQFLIELLQDHCIGISNSEITAVLGEPNSSSSIVAPQPLLLAGTATEETIIDNSASKTIETANIKVNIVGKIDLSKFQKKRKIDGGNGVYCYIIDTNVFVECPDVINRINSKHQIVISAKVMDELDKLKITLDANGRQNVQKALRNINNNLDTRSNLTIEVADLSLLPPDYSTNCPDNLIMSVAMKFKNHNPIMLTSDIGFQNKVKGVGIKTLSLREFLRENKV